MFFLVVEVTNADVLFLEAVEAISIEITVVRPTKGLQELKIVLFLSK